jgi:hypothetical protein
VITPHTSYGWRVSQPADEPLDPAYLPIAHLGGGDHDDDDGNDGNDEPPHRPAHLRAIVITAIAVVAVGLVVGIIVFNSSAPKLGRGAGTASDAASTFVAALNAGDEKAAADIACDSFADPAKAAARTGSDPGISFALGRLTMVSNTAAHVSVQERIQLPGGKTHAQLLTLVIVRSSGSWLVCGRVG